MAVAAFQISEYNGAGETETTNVSNINAGNVDSANITPGPSNAITAGNNAFDQYFKCKLTTFPGTLNQVSDLRVWKSSGTYTTGISYDTSLKTSSYTQPSYATPATSTYSANSLPSSDPGSANLGIGGALAGTLTALNAYSDRLRIQLHTTGSTPAGTMNTLTFTLPQWLEQ
jgi:hypothetical protein